MWPKHFKRLNHSEEEDRIMLISLFTSNLAAISPDDYEKFFIKLKKVPITHNKLKKIVPKLYYKYLTRWDPVEVNKVSLKRHINYRINLQEGATPLVKRAYGFSREQATVVKKYIKEMLRKGYIQESLSLYTTPVLIVKKSNKGLRVCVDYRALNALTIKNRNTPPLIRETLNRLYLARIYTKFDVIAVFNEIRIREGDEEKIIFLIKYRLFKYIIIPFRLYNAPGTF